MTLMDTLIIQKKNTGGLLPKIVTFVYTYYTKEKYRRIVTQNSGIRIKSFDSLGMKTTYYGYIHDIWELDYSAKL
jgi:hypothetical protein